MDGILASRIRKRWLSVALASMLALTVAAPAFAGTWEYNVYYSKTTLGVKDWTYRHKVLFSGNGTTISSYSVSDWSSYLTAGWTFYDSSDGSTFTYTSGGKQHKRKETNGHFQLKLAGVVWDNDYPWVETTVRADGAHWLNGKSY